MTSLFIVIIQQKNCLCKHKVCDVNNDMTTDTVQFINNGPTKIRPKNNMCYVIY